MRSSIEMEKPLVSVVMPAYKSGDTIASAVLSVVTQRLENWELLIIDDGSPESMEDELAFFGDRRIRYIRLPENRGLAHALNFGISEARARFIARMDADDVMEEWRLSDQVKYMITQHIAVCGTGAEKFGLETGGIRNASKGPEIVNSFLAGNPFVHPTMMFDRAQLGDQLRYNESFRCEEDYELWSRIVTATNCENIDYSTLKYRIAGTSNANHPQKKRLNRIVLQQFARRMGVEEFVPIETISEFQMAGYINEEGFLALRSYAKRAHRDDLPRLGWIQEPLMAHAQFAGFFRWLNSVRQFSPYRY